MNTIGIALIWCMVQITLLGLLAAGLYLLIRRLRPAAAAPVVFSSLVTVVILSILALSPWPRWTIDSPLPLGEGSGLRACNSHLLPGEGPGVRASDASLHLGDEPEVRASDSLHPSGDGSQRIASNSPLLSGEGQGVRAVKSGPVASRTRASSALFLWRTLLAGLSNSPAAVSEDTRRWPTVVAVVLLLVMACGLGWLMLGLVAVRWQRRRSQPVYDVELLELIDLLRAELGCRRPVEVRQSGDLSTAATIGWLRPVVLLPADWRHWTPDQRRAVLAHEIVHARSHDFVALLFGQFGLMLHCYHPLLHWLMNRLRLEQELAADAAAASVSGGPRQYLSTIAELALRTERRRLSWPTRTFLPTRTTFLRRIAMLRDSEPRSDHLSRAVRWTVIGVVFSCGLLVAGLRGPAGQTVLAADASTASKEKLPSVPTDPQSDGIDLSYVPRNAIGFFAIRPQVILKRPELADLAKMLKQQLGDAIAGVSPTDIEQISQVVLGASDEPGGLMMVRTAAPNDFKWLGKTVKATDKREYRGKTYFRGSDNGSTHVVSVYCPDDRTFAAGSSEGVVKDLIDAQLDSSSKSLGRPKFISAEQWKSFQSDQAVLALDTKAPLIAVNLGGEITTGAELMLFRKTDLVLAGVRCGDEVKAHAVFTGRNEEIAKEVAAYAEVFRNWFAVGLVNCQRHNWSDRQTDVEPFMEWACGVGGSILKAAKVEHQGTTIRLQGQVPMTTIAKSLPTVALRLQSRKQLQEIQSAMLSFAQAGKRFPPAVLYGPDGKTPYSWRVALLPYLGQMDLYKQYNFDEPWDSPSNRKVLDQMPAAYRAPTEPADSKNACCFALVGPDTMLGGREGRRLMDKPGHYRCILFVEAKRAIPWTKPEDIAYDPKKPVPKLGGYYDGGYYAAIDDGYGPGVHFMPDWIPEKELRPWIAKDEKVVAMRVADEARASKANYEERYGVKTAPSKPVAADETAKAIVELKALGAKVTIAPNGKAYAVYLRELEIGDEVLPIVARLPDLRELGLERTNVTDAGLKHLQPLRKLEYLMLTETSIGDAGVHELRNLPQLYHLNLGGTKATDAAIADLVLMPKLTSLCLDTTRLTDRGLERLTALKRLERLTMNATKITDDGLRHLKQFPNLWEVQLYMDGITDKGVKHLAEVRELRILNLQHTEVTNAALEDLAKLSKLEDLDLSVTKVSKLEPLKGLKQLRELFLSGSKVTDADAKDFQKALPQCRIIK